MTDAEQFETFMREYRIWYSAPPCASWPINPRRGHFAGSLPQGYERFADLRNSPTVAGWLKTVATNMSLNHLSRYRARWSFFSELPRRAKKANTWKLIFQSRRDLQADVANADASQRVERALQKLPPAQRVPLVLFHLENLRLRRDCAKLNVSLGKVKTDIFRGRQALQKMLRSATGPTN